MGNKPNQYAGKSYQDLISVLKRTDISNCNHITALHFEIQKCLIERQTEAAERSAIATERAANIAAASVMVIAAAAVLPLFF